MTIRRRSPSGHIIEEREGGLYFIEGSVLPWSQLDVAHHVTAFNETKDGTKREMYRAEIGYSHSFDDGVAEWGVGKTPDEAIRYALGNHYGDHSDPIVEEPESIKGWSHYQHRIELAEAVTLIQYTKWTDEGVLIVYDSRTDADDGEPLGPFCATCGEYVELPDNLLVEHA